MGLEILCSRNPSSSFVGFLLDTELNDEQFDFAYSVQKASSHLMVLINDILDFSKIEAGKLELEHAQFLLARHCLLLEREAEQTDLERLLDPEREIHGFRLVTWVRLGMVALFLWYAL